MENATKLFLIRHGEVEEPYLRVYGGRIDMNLSERGREQAARLARHLDGSPLDAIYCSSMKRARQTLEPIEAAFEIEPEIRDDLREIDFGAWTGVEWEEVARRHEANVADWLQLLNAGLVEGAETTVDLQARVTRCLEEIHARHAGGSIAVVCHGAVIRAALSRLLRLPMDRMGSIDVGYASVSLIEQGPLHSTARYLNYIPWKFD